MKDFIMFAGPNGSGKSTVRDTIINPVEVVIDPDRIARELNPGDPKSAEGMAGREALRRSTKQSKAAARGRWKRP